MTSKGEEGNYDDCLKVALFLMNLVGLGYNTNFSKVTGKLYRIYQVFTQMGVIIFTVGVTVEMYVLRDDTENALEMIGWIITHIILCYKLYVFVIRKPEINYLISTLPKNFVIDGKNRRIDNKDLADIVMKGARSVVMTYAIVMGSSIVLYVDISPLINYMTSAAEVQNITLFNQTEGAQRELPVRLWLPFDTTETPMFEITYVYLAICAHTEGMLSCSIDVFCMSVIIILTGQFELLCDALKNSTNYSLARSESTTQKGVNYDNQQKIMDNDIPNISNYDLEEAEDHLEECIKHHQKLIDFSERLNSLVSSIFFLQFLTASIMICMLGFRLTTMDFDINLMKLLSYLLTCICQLCLYSIFGSNLMTQSEAVHNAVYDCEWYDQSNHFKKSITMIIMRAQKPVTIMAGQFGSLCLPLFASMMQSSYSYLALLMQLNEEVEDE
ncbi:Odorant receptor 54 [Blattella germanica]|nr:Odorant receptor 54 [Blattella germanica]